MSEKTWKDDDEVLVFVKFRGTHKGTKIKVSYLQYKNLRQVANIEQCEIISSD